MSLKFKLAFISTLLCSSMAFAGEWETGMEGSATGLYGYTQSSDRFSDQNSHNNGMGDAKLSAYAKYLFGADWEAGIYADLMLGVDHELEDYNQGKWGEEVYGIVDSSYGRLMIGQTWNVAAQFHTGAPDAGPLGIENSDIVDFIFNPNWQRKGSNARFATLNTTYINTDGVAPKISYITPEYYGTMLGFTYVPETYNRRGLVSKSADYEDKGGYIVSLYNYLDFDIFNLTTTLGYADFIDNDQEYSASMSLSHGNWTLGGGWRMTEADDKNPISANADMPEFFDGYREGYAWNVGLGYEIGPYKTSLSYFESHAKESDNEDRILMFSNRYQVNKNLDVYLSAAKVDFRGQNRDVSQNNKGYAVVSGLSMNF